MKKLIEASMIISLLLIIIFFTISEGQAISSGPTHSQPKLQLSTSKISKILTPFMSTGYTLRSDIVAINFYSNPKLANRNYLLNENERICVGDTVYLSDLKLSGEWFSKGGPFDSPPVVWVSNERLDEIINRVLQFNDQMSDIAYETKHGMGDSYTSKEFDDIILYVEGFGDVGLGAATVICAPNSQLYKDDNVDLGKDSFEVTKEGLLTFEISYSPTCYYYIESIGRAAYKGGFQEFLKERSYSYTNVYMLYKIPLTDLTASINLQAIGESKKPNLEVKDYSIVGDDIRIIITNTGGLPAQLDDIKSNCDLSINNNPIINPGETKEVFGTISGDIDGNKLNFNLVYRTTDLGCLNKKEYDSFSPEECRLNDECITGLCCAGKCRGPSKGFCDDTDRDGIPDTWVKTG